MAGCPVRGLSTVLECGDDVTTRRHQSSQRHHGGQDLAGLSVQPVD